MMTQVISKHRGRLLSNLRTFSCFVGAAAEIASIIIRFFIPKTPDLSNPHKYRYILYARNEISLALRKEPDASEQSPQPLNKSRAIKYVIYVRSNWYRMNKFNVFNIILLVYCTTTHIFMLWSARLRHAACLLSVNLATSPIILG